MGTRWDAVVQNDRFWAEAPHPAQVVPAAVAGEPISVQVWLFGSLADALEERPLTLQLARPFCVGDVIAELGRRCGGDFLSRVSGPDGRKYSHCRVYVDGRSVEDTAAPVQTASSCAQVELILLTAAEGG